MLNQKDILEKFKKLSISTKVIILGIALYIFIFISEEAKIFQLQSLYFVCCTIVGILLITFIVYTIKSLIFETKKTLNDTKKEFKEIKEIVKGENK